MTMDDDVYRLARDAYLKKNPAPQPGDFACGRCGARAGQPCTVRRGDRTFHRSRSNKWIKAFNRRQADAVQAGDDAVDKGHER